MIDLIDVTKTFYMGENQLQALKGINLHINTGELVAIIGASGSGKTSTMNIIGLLDKPTTGKYLLNNEDVSTLKGDQLAKLRNRSIGFIFQSFFLLPKLTAVQNVGLPLYYRNISARKIKRISMEMLDKVGMADHASHHPYELSGGQQQRVAIARALAGEPKIILADEPTGALDSSTSQIIMDLLLAMGKQTTVVIITHDPNVASQCRRIVKIDDGVIQT